MKKTAANISVPFLLILPVLWACSGDEGDWDATGSFEATEVTVSSEVSGRIESIHAEEGRILEKGALAAEIDTVQLYLKKMQLESTLEAIRASRADIGLQIAATREQIAHNENEVARTRRLIEAQAANSKQLDDLASNSRVLQKQLSAQLSTLTKSNAAAEANAKSTEYQILQTKDQIRRCRIENPVRGTVLVKYAQQGELASPGRALYKIADTGTMYLRAYVTADQLSYIKVGSPARVFSDYGSDGRREYRGRVSWVSDKAEFTPKGIKTRDERASTVYAVKIETPNDGYIKIGQWGEVIFDKHDDGKH